MRSFENGLAGVKQNGLWGFIDTKGKAVILAQFHDIGSFHDIGGSDSPHLAVAVEALVPETVPEPKEILFYPSSGEDAHLIEGEDPSDKNGELYAVFEVEDCFEMVRTKEGRSLSRVTETDLRVSAWWFNRG